MRLSAILGYSCTAISCVHASYNIAAFEEAKYEISNMVEDLFEERLLVHQADAIRNVFHKRDTTDTIASILNMVNDSDILFGILDQIAYSPEKIELLANATASLVGDVNLTSISDLTSNLNVDLNYTSMYEAVQDSGVVTSLLDGILLDDDFRPTLSKLVSRVLEGNKNLFNYLVKNIFKKSSKRDSIAKRSNGGTLEVFVGNIISSALSSSLVGNLAEDVLTALNETQFLTDTVKRLIADEGYQNMTAQFAIDFLNTGKVKIDSKTVNITSIVDKALSKPAVILNVVSSLLSGNVQFASLGKYTDAVKEIIQDVEDDGTFADLNEYVFSETHSVTTPLIPTNDIVVAKTTKTTKTTKTATTSKTTKTAAASTGGSNSTEISIDLSALSEFGAGAWSSATSTSTVKKTSTTTTAATDSSAAEVASLLSLIRASSAYFAEDSDSDSSTTETTTTSTSKKTTTTGTTVTTTSSAQGLLDILIGLGSTTTTANAKREARSTVQEGAGSSNHNSATKVIVYLHAVFVGALLIL